MTKITITQFAEDIGISSERLCEQLNEVGLSDKSALDVISEKEKSILLRFLRQKHGKEEGVEPKKIVLKRKTVSKIRIPMKTAQGSSRAKPRVKTVNVEFRRHRTYAKRSLLIEDINKERETAERERALKIKEEEAIAKAEKERKIKELDKKLNETKKVVSEEKKAATAPADQPVVAQPVNETEIAAPAPKEKKEEKKQEKAATDTVQAAQQAAPETKQPKVQQKHTQDRSELHVASEKSGRRKKKFSRARSASVRSSKQHSFEKPTAPIIREVDIPEHITVAELARRMSVKGAEVIKIMMKLGCMANINQNIDQDTAAIVVEEMGHTAKILQSNVLEEEIGQLLSKKQGEGVARAPVVTIMGHVDHGKTSLLDYIRRSRIAAAEKGGITQHIGAYRVSTDNGDITFLDTPGHQAFTAMRARGAKVTDIVVIVVAADDGVMPQTEEAITHAKASATAVIVAINKIDKEGTDPERIKQQLSKHDLIPEDWGGDTLFIPISAKTGQGIDQLLASIALQAELMELKAADTGAASGIVIESRLDIGRGPIASILVQQGCLKKGDIILSGCEFGRIRAMIGDSGEELMEAGPSTPVEILGLSGVPNASDEMIVVSSERKAKEIALLRKSKYRELQMTKKRSEKNKDLLSKMEGNEKSVLNLLIKADVHGSVEAIASAVTQLDNKEVKVNIVSRGVGGITESDVNLAIASQGFIIGFNVRADSTARKLVSTEGIDLHYYSVIYDVINDIKKLLSGLLEPEIREQIIGIAEVRDVFRSPKFGDIAGCLVTSGIIKQNSAIRVLRNNIVIYQGVLESLRRFKDDVSKVQSGTECGIGVKNYNDIKAGDQIEVFESIEVQRNL